MGCFHSDFESDKGEVLYGTEAYYISKKAYGVKLAVEEEVKDADNKAVKGIDGKNLKTGEIVDDYHLRLKGIDRVCLTEKADDNYEKDPMSLYEDMFKTVHIIFDLADVKVIMR